MPGLSQLKKFSADILSLGDEPGLRASRGEKPVVVPIPKGIEDKDDSDDFITGMPEPVDYDVKPEKAAEVEEDFSDIMGTGQKASGAPKAETEQEAAISVPDLSSLADLGAFGGTDGDGDAGVPDLSMFEEPIEESEPEPEPEPEEPEISDMSLEDLLGGTGFDGSEGAEEEQPEVEPEETFDVPEDTSGAQTVDVDDIINNAIKAGNAASFGDTEELSEPENLDGLDSLASDDFPAPAEEVEAVDPVDSQEPVDFQDSVTTPDSEFNIDDELAALGAEDSGFELEPDVKEESAGNSGFSLDDLKITGDEETAASLDADFGADSFETTDIEPAPEVPDLSEGFDDISVDQIEELPETKQKISDSQLFDVDSIVLTETDKNPSEHAEDENEAGEASSEEPSFTSSDFGDIEIEDFSTDEKTSAEEPASDFDLDSLSMDEPAAESAEPSVEEPSLEIGETSEPEADSFGLDDLSFGSDDLSFDMEEPKKSPEAEKTDLEFETNEPSIDMGADLPEEISEVPAPEMPEAEPSLDTPETAPDAGNDFALDENPFGDVSMEDFSLPDENAETAEGEEDNYGDIPGGLFDSADMEMPDLGGDTSFDEPATDEASATESQSEDDFGSDLSEAKSFDDSAAIDSLTQEGGNESDQADFGDVNLNTDESLDSFGDLDFNMDSDADAAQSSDSMDDFGLDSDSGDSSEGSESLGLGDDFPDTFDLDGTSSDDAGAVPEETGPIETFDTSAMEGLDFGIPDTDSQISGNSGFELGSSDDFGMDNGDFEIPGFSDVDEVAVSKNGKIKVPVAEKQKEEVPENSDLPPNTLSDAQYEKFLKNLATYPLNVRMAVEELIVKNEFTDEAEFEIVTKVLKKVSARQLASELEKMLNISIPVPRDFERRTAEEYDAYKQSFQYQLKNKIIPGAVLTIAAVIVCFFLFEFAKNFIYKPARASMLYKQGYVLLENEDFPQSETKFNEAVKYNLQKKWFFKYARGYKDHKQYLRAEQMFKNILYCFKHDLTAGLEYASMELEDLANYEKTEQILLRDVLDYHVNDMNGILLLGDNYLEWATEKDPSKYDSARKCYSELIQLYGENQKNMDLFSSRMMRYFIRTDNLREVLMLKNRFFPRARSISGEDWTDLSGYLLEKLYGPLPPSEEYLRGKIEDIKELLVRAVRTNPSSPVAHYNIAKYYIHMNNSMRAKSSLVNAIDAFEKKDILKKKDMYKFVDSYRLLGEEYTKDKEYIKAMESFTDGIALFTRENIGTGLPGVRDVGKLYSDYGDIEYYISGDMDGALQSYQDAVSNDYDIGEIRYKIGYIQYGKQNYSEAIGSFMKAGEDFENDTSLLLAMGNALSLRNDNYAAQSYYQRLLNQLNEQKSEKGVLFPQVRKDEAEIVENFLKTTNNLGVTLYRLARRTGNSSQNAQAIVNLQDSLRAWDSITRNQQSMVRLGGSNLAEQNIRYITHPRAGYEPAIYTDIPKSLTVEEGIIK